MGGDPEGAAVRVRTGVQMKTEIIFRSGYPNRPVRRVGYDFAGKVPVYHEPRTITGTTVMSFQPYKTKPYSRKRGHTVSFAGDYEVEATGRKFECVRQIAPEYVDQLHDLDVRIETLQQERRELLAEADRRSTALTVDQVRAMFPPKGSL
jgi:hypothetical protein